MTEKQKRERKGLDKKQRRERETIRSMIQWYRDDARQRGDSFNVPQPVVNPLADWLYENGVRA